MGNCIDKRQQTRAIDEQQMTNVGIAKENSMAKEEEKPKGNSEEKNQKRSSVITKIEDFHISSSDLVTHKKTSIYEDYNILGSSLGTGSYGSVHKALHKQTGILRAIKFISKDLTCPEDQKRLLNEVQMLKNVDHPNIIQVFECFEDEKNFYIVTELCTGGELYDKIKACGYLTDKEAAAIMHQILSAVNYCHKSHIVHRDLKPENILYESPKPNARLKVIDFGTSRTFNPKKKMTQRQGTPLYVAPEVLNGVYDYKCDIWSCGVILYILLSGRPPFYGPNDKALLDKVRSGVYSFDGIEWEDVSRSAIDLISKMMCFDPTKRLSASQALQHPWMLEMLSKDSVAKPLTKKVLENLASFACKQKIQEGIFVLIVNMMITNEERASLTQVFKSLDLNGDGKLSFAELVKGYTKILGDEATAKTTVENILKKTDLNESGAIDYSEFIRASVDRKKLLTKEKLEKIFSWFDKDGSKSISREELKEMLGAGKSEEVTETVWENLMREVDKNGDGEVIDSI